jgi:hypothetical protein
VRRLRFLPSRTATVAAVVGLSGVLAACGGGSSGGGAKQPSHPTNGLIGGYLSIHDGPKVSDITANAPNYNLQYAAFATGSDHKGHVAFKPSHQSAASLKADIIASKAAGSTWLLSLGGGGDKTIRLTSQTQATTMYNSLTPIIDNYGFEGLDFDLECGSDCLDPASAVALAGMLKDKYGQGFLISATPRPFEVRSKDSVYGQFVVQAGDKLDLLGMQDYDFPEAADSAKLTEAIDGDIATLIKMGVPASKILIGCITYSKYENGHNTVDAYKDIYVKEQKKYPDLRGVFIWDTQMDQEENWSFTRTMAPAVRGL